MLNNAKFLNKYVEASISQHSQRYRLTMNEILQSLAKRMLSKNLKMQEWTLILSCQPQPRTLCNWR